MKKNVNKVSSEFEKLLSDEFQNKWDNKSKILDVPESHANKKDVKEAETINNEKHRNDAANKKSDSKSNDDKK
jgi:hypothetical protein